MNLSWLSQSQIQSGLRHVYTALGSALATALLFGVLSQDNVNVITEAVHDIGDGITKIAAGISLLIPIVSGAFAMWSASRHSKLTSLAADPEVKQIVVKSDAVADAVPSSKVVSSGGKS